MPSTGPPRPSSASSSSTGTISARIAPPTTPIGRSRSSGQARPCRPRPCAPCRLASAPRCRVHRADHLAAGQRSPPRPSCRHDQPHVAVEIPRDTSIISARPAADSGAQTRQDHHIVSTTPPASPCPPRCPPGARRPRAPRKRSPTGRCARPHGRPFPKSDPTSRLASTYIDRQLVCRTPRAFSRACAPLRAANPAPTSQDSAAAILRARRSHLVTRARRAAAPHTSPPARRRSRSPQPIPTGKALPPACYHHQARQHEDDRRKRPLCQLATVYDVVFPDRRIRQRP